MSTVISIENVSKLYRLGLISGGTLRADFERWWTQLRGKPDPLLKIGEPDHGNRDGEFILALRDISVEVKEGEIVGIIGRNGAGKSTLLKILAQVTAPTSGQIKVKGRVASLLEVGTGFHPELTGRENIFLNGAILGMTRAEMKRKFDEIVAFAELEKFIDTPVKRYSSGMYVRLAFAVAAHLDSEILLVDEVLAVGDLDFQKKCFGKMRNVAQGGRTVLFVSHHMPSIAALCKEAILITRGEVELRGLASDVIWHYISAGGKTTGGEVTWDDPQSAPGNQDIRLRSVRVFSPEGKVTNHLRMEDDVTMKIAYWNFKEGATYILNINLKDQDGAWVLSTLNIPSANIEKDPWFDRPHPVGLFETVCRIPGNFLNNHRYSIYLAIARSNLESPAIRAEDILSFTVYDTGAMGHEHPRPFLGPVRPRLLWRTEFRETERSGCLSR